MDYGRFITCFSQKRKLNAIRDTVRLRSIAPPQMVFFGAGFPSKDAIPIDGMSITLNGGLKIDINPDDLKEVLQYGPTNGHIPLVRVLEDLIKRFHSPPCWKDTEIIVTPGGQDGLFASIEMLIKPNDSIIIEEPCYSGFLSILEPYEPHFIQVKCDSQGMNPKLLRKALSHWNQLNIRDKKDHVPKVMYVNPNGNNPSGVSYTEQRKREIYEIASEYNLIILEDDPYYFLQFKDIKDYAPSFLSMDVDGRVVRFDSFSKLISPGIRLGFVTAPKPFIERISLHLQVSNLHASGLSQLVVYEILKHWDNEGLLKHVSKIRSVYEERRNAMLAAANKYLTGLCKWSIPDGGMFMWFQISQIKDSSKMITERGIKNNVYLLPGSGFYPNATKPSNCLRASYSTVPIEDIDKGIENLANLIKEEIKLEEGKRNLE